LQLQSLAFTFSERGCFNLREVLKPSSSHVELTEVSITQALKTMPGEPPPGSFEPGLFGYRNNKILSPVRLGVCSFCCNISSPSVFISHIICWK